MNAPALSLRMTPSVWMMLIVLSVMWGGSFFFIEVAITGLPTFTIVALRVGLAAIALHLWLALSGRHVPFGIKVWRSFLIMGFLNNAVPFALIVWGQSTITSGLASILNATTPLFTVLVAHLWTEDEKLTLPKVIGVLIGFAGAVVMVGPDALRGVTGDVLAQLAVLGAALFYAFSGVFGRRFRRLGVTPIDSAAGQLTASTILLLPLALAVDRPWTIAAPSTEVWLAVAGQAILSTALAYLLFYRILAASGATGIMLVTFLIPVSAIFLGATFLGEILEPAQIGGMALIGLGLAAIDGRPVGWLTGRR